MRLIFLAAAMFATGCSGSPTSPTPVAEARVSESRASQSPVGGAPDDGVPGGVPGGGAPSEGTPSRPAIRWDVIAPGCSPQPAPSPLPDPHAATLAPANGMTSATWPWTSAGRSVLLIAYFIEDDGMLKLCSWDTSDL